MLLQEMHNGVDFPLLFSDQIIPPAFELAGEFDLPDRSSTHGTLPGIGDRLAATASCIMPFRDYAVKGISIAYS
jgi:hypothetical protein